MLKLSLTKGKDGVVHIVADDLRGLTGYRGKRRGVRVADVGSAVAELCAEHQAIVDKIKAARSETR